MTRRNLSLQPQEDQRRREQADDLEGALKQRLPPGVLLEGVSFKALERRTLRHGLGVRPRGVMPSVARGAATFLYQLGADSSGITLENATSNEATFDLWVYR
jgi:hypothetical protein